MYMKEKKKNRVVAMFMCILLLSNFLMNIAYATEMERYMQQGAGIILDSVGQNGSSNISTNEYTTLLSLDSFSSRSSNGNPVITFTPRRSGVYTISLTEKSGENLRYNITTNVDPSQAVRLAGKYVSFDQYAVMTSPFPKNNTKVDVVLQEGVTYRIELERYPNGTGEFTPMVAGDVEDTAATDYFPVIFSVEKHNIDVAAFAALNIDANKITNPASAAMNQRPLETYINPTDIRIFEFSPEELEEYWLYGAPEEDDERKNDKGSALEGILADIIILVGTILTNIVEMILGIHDGVKVSLTIDNIIFNRVDYVTINLTPLGGIKLNNDTNFQGKNIFDNPTVLNIIKTLYDGLKILAVLVYIVMLLYIGVRILLSVGTKEQRKYTKYLESWVTGIVILVFVPYFLPAIPQISNAIVELIGENSQSMQRTITTEEVLERLGRKDLLGEDAEVVELNRMIDERIEELNGKIDGEDIEKTKEEAKKTLEQAIKNYAKSDKYNGYIISTNLKLEDEIETVENYIDENYDVWDESHDEEYIKMINSVVQKIMMASKGADNVINNAKKKAESDLHFVLPLRDTNIMRAEMLIKENVATWNNSNQTELNKIYTIIETSSAYDSTTASKIKSTLNRVKQALEFMSNELKTRIRDMLDTYKNAVVKEEIDYLEKAKMDIAGDIMTTLKTYAQKQNRLVYAVAWAMLLYQGFAVLFMYYKRIFAVIILILLFPIVMAFYVFDKMDDGESQALKVWVKEFFANIFVQVLHATIYVTIINIGIKVCSMDPAKNWFFLLLTVCFLFPGERILRGVLGLESSTLGQLRNHIMSSVMAGAAAFSFARNGYNLSKRGINAGGDLIRDLKDNHGKETMDKIKNKIEKPEKDRENAKAEKRKHRSDLEESKKNARRVRQEKIAAGEANILDKTHEKLSVTKDAIIGSGVGQAAILAGNTVKNVAHAIGSNKVIKGIAKTGRYAYRTGKFTLKKGYGLAKKGTGLAMGAAEGVESFAKDNSLAGGITTAYHTSKAIGGFKNQKKTPLRVTNAQRQGAQNRMQAQNANRMRSVYSNGVKVSGNNTGKPSPGSTPRRRASRAPSYRDAEKIRAKIRTNVNVNRNNKT